jgi:hypothetical protein
MIRFAWQTMLRNISHAPVAQGAWEFSTFLGREAMGSFSLLRVVLRRHLGRSLKLPRYGLGKKFPPPTRNPLHCGTPKGLQLGRAERKKRERMMQKYLPSRQGGVTPTLGGWDGSKKTS